MSDTVNAAPSRQSFFDRLRGPMTLLMIALGGFALYYSLFFERKTSYYRERNGRLAGRLADQIRRAINNTERIVSSAASVPGKDFQKLYSFKRGLSEEQRQPQAIFDNLELIADPTGTHEKRSFARITKDGIITFEGRAAANVVASLDLKSPEDSTGRRSRPAEPKQYASASIPLKRLINGIVTQTAGDVFDTVFILDNGGNVIYQSTPWTDDERSSNVRIERLTELRVPKLLEKESTLQVSDLMSASRQMAVQIGDSSYQLFSVPVRTTLEVVDDAPPQPAAKIADKGAGDKPAAPAHTWVVCAIVSNAKFRSTSLAMSVTTLCCLGAVVLLTFFSWPFAKMALSSAQVKVTLMDVVLLGAGGILATSIVCLFVLDWFALRKLEATADRQLETLAGDITKNFRAEIDRAMVQFDEAQAWAEKEIREKRANPRNSNLLEHFRPRSRPFFQSFALISREGKQEVKWSVDDPATPLTSIATRGYFTAPFKGGRDYLFFGGRRLTIESIRSTATGQPEVAFSRHTTDARPPGVNEIRKALPVIAMSVPSALSVIDPIVPRDFGFAIIDPSGTVLFHSQRERNTVENFFDETDDNPRIRAAVEARQNEIVNVRYWGTDYRAFVQPMKDLPWTLITFREKCSLRTINAEALTITLFFLMAIFGVALFAFIALVLLLKPRYRAEWIWPDPARVGAYAELAAAYLVLLVVAVVALLGLGDGALLAFPFWFIALVLVITYLYLRADLHGPKRVVFVTIAASLAGGLLAVLWRDTAGIWGVGAMSVATVLLVAVGARAVLRPSDRVSPHRADELQKALPLCYVGAAFLLLLLTSAIPAASFFKAACELEMGSYVKSVQMRLAGDLQSRWWRIAGELDEDRGKGKEKYRQTRWHDERLDLYADAAYETTFKLDVAPRQPSGPRSVKALPDLIERILPRFSDASVQTRELLHDRAADDLWWWANDSKDPARVVLTMKNAEPLRPFTISSSVPSLLPSLRDIGRKSTLRPEPFAFAAMGLLLICAVAFTVARFIARRVFLVDLVHPLWLEQGFLVPRHVLCHPCDDTSARRLFRDFRWIDLSSETDLEAARTAPETFEAFEPAVFIDHLDYAFAAGEQGAAVRALIDRLTRNGDRTVVLRPTALTVVTSSFLKGEHREEWARILSSFIWVNGSRLVASAKRLTLTGSVRVPVLDVEPATTRRWRWPGLRALCALSGFASYCEQFTDSRQAIERALAREAEADPYLETVMKGLGTRASGVDQLLDEFGERAEEYYTALWHTCAASEQLVLMQIAQTGLVNGKARKDVRRLLARGLLRRDLQLCLMNETFRRFVIAQCATSALSKELEQNLAGDAWNRFRVPFFATIAAVLLFFFTTQRQTFDATIALVGSLAASLPVFLKTISKAGVKAE